MIVLNSMRWSHAFSYGANNQIDFTKAPLIQLIGKNGHGKSSIALILEEVLFNKNSKGIKKTNVLNRYTKEKKYWIELDFAVNTDSYLITTTRGSTQTVVLTKNGEDISAHTATATYKLIEEIIGMDHKTFTQIVYQSSAYSLEFLTATDSNRKKFLIDLLNLVRYTELCENFKGIAKDVANTLTVTEMKQKTVDNWLAKFSKESIEEAELSPEPDSSLLQLCESELPQLQEKIATIASTNKKISQNNKYKEILAGINITPVVAPTTDLIALQVSEREAKAVVANLSNTIKGVGPIITKCGSCGQPIDSSHKEAMLKEATAKLPEAKLVAAQWSDLCKEAKAIKDSYDTYLAAQQEWERYYSFIDRTLPEQLIDIDALNARKVLLDNTLAKYNKDLKAVREHNAKIAAHNAKVKVLVEQLESMQKDKAEFASEFSSINSRLATLQILVKSFGTSGLVAYKIENLVKDLEELANEYLQDMSDGRFQLGFTISASDKLDVVITDNGQDIDIFALSNGELARVNVSTLLAIRKLMQSLSDTKINLLILDETVESLDVDGKERLVEVLLKEQHLNTILVSHGFSHPLLEKLNIVKDNHISRIE